MDSEEEQKTGALKRAYADIILNTAKEAAARIMLSERKAFRFQQDLCSAKNEALQLLLRLKHMIDTKTNEVEMTSIEQRRKIEELEAQLCEAEDVVTDLRTELNHARDRLRTIKKNNQVHPLNQEVEFPNIASDRDNILTNQTKQPCFSDKQCIVVKDESTSKQEKEKKGEEKRAMIWKKSVKNWMFKRRRKSRYRRSKMGLLRPCNPSSVLSLCRLFSLKANNNTEEETVKNSQDAEVKNYGAKLTCEPSSTILTCKTLSYRVKGSIQSTEDQSEIKPFPHLDPGLTLIKSDVNSMLGSNCVTTISIQAISKPSAALNVEEDNVQEEKKSEIREEPPPCQADRNRLLKYTFQRKRKKDSMTVSDGNTNPGTMEKAG